MPNHVDEIHKASVKDEIAGSCNRRLALAIRKVNELREASYDPGTEKSVDTLNGVGHQGFSEWARYPGYTKTYSACIQEVVGDDPIATILGCLFTAGYCDMFEFADQVLGPETPK